MKELKKEISQSLRSATDWRELESWVHDAESRLAAVSTNRSQLSKIGTALTYEFDRLDMAGGEHKLFQICLVAKHRPLLANVMWCKVQSTLHSLYHHLDVNYPRTMPLFSAQRHLPIFWDLIKRQHTDPNWLELPSFSGRLKSTEAFVRFVDAHLKRPGITQCMYREVMKVLEECERLPRKKDIAQMAKGLKLALAEVREPGKDWRGFCRTALQSAVKKPVDDLFPVAPYCSAIATSASEIDMIDKAIDDAASTRKKSKHLEAWVKHLASSDCTEPPLRLINLVCLRYWIVRSYEDASLPDRSFKGPLNDLLRALLSVIEAALRKKMVWDPQNFDAFCQLLPRFERSYYLQVPIISRCEDYAAKDKITETQRQLIDIYYSMPEYSQEASAIKRWHLLNAQIKRTAPKKKT